MGFFDLFRRAAPIGTRDALMDFLDRQSAFLAQKGIFEYSRARAGPYGNILFDDKSFLAELEKSRWLAFPAMLGMVGEAVEGVLRPGAGDRRPVMLQNLTAAALADLRPLSGAAAIDRAGLGGFAAPASSRTSRC